MRKQLSHQGIGNSEDPEMYFAGIEDMRAELADAGDPVSDEALKRLIVSNLSGKYEIVQQTLLLGMTPYTLAELKDKIRACHQASLLKKHAVDASVNYSGYSGGGGGSGRNNSGRRQGRPNRWFTGGRGGGDSGDGGNSRGGQQDRGQRDGGNYHQRFGRAQQPAQHSSQERSRQDNGGGKGPRCYECNEMGHIKRNCPKRGAGGATRSSARANQATEQPLHMHRVLVAERGPCRPSWLPGAGCNRSSARKKGLWQGRGENHVNFIVDSGAAHTMVNDIGLLTNLKVCSHDIRGVGDTQFFAKLSGDFSGNIFTSDGRRLK
ncbi:unnamed protein product, partial [Phaeothamnion confervicola]